jgi:FixJ family two-component response regulator
MPHLFLVDDDDLFRESLGLNLVDEGYEVTSFDSVTFEIGPDPEQPGKFRASRVALEKRHE